MDPTRCAAALMIALAPLAGCGSLADAQYQGEPLMRIDGSIVSSEADLPPMEVALLWQIDPTAMGCDRLSDAVARVATVGAFPSSFHLIITQPPPASAFSFGSTVAEAYVAALDANNRAHGVAANAGKVVFKVFYAQRDIAAGSPESMRFGGTGLRAGYQLGIWDLSGSDGAVLRLAGDQEQVSIEVFGGAGATIEPACDARRPMPGPPTVSPPASN